MTAKDPNQWPWQLGGTGFLALVFGWLTKRVVEFRPVSLGVSDAQSLAEIARLLAENTQLRQELAQAAEANADLRVRVAELSPHPPSLNL